MSSRAYGYLRVSFILPFAFSAAPFSWSLLFPPMCFLSFLWSLWSFPVRHTMGSDRYTPSVVAIYSIVHILVGSIKKGGFEGDRRAARAGTWARRSALT